MKAVVIRVVCTLAAVGLVAFVNRSATANQASPEAVRCELDPPRDAAGLEACVARSPRDAETLLELAAAYEAAGRPADARATYQRAIEVDPRDEALMRQFAAAVSRLGVAPGSLR